MKFYGYFRSSAAFRLRIGLKLKGLEVETEQVHLRRDGGEQHRTDYRALNPQGLVPALEEGGQIFTQSLAILEYLDERHPEPPFLPSAPAARAHARAIALAIACDIHPIDNLRVLNYLEREMGQPQEARDRWYRHWVEIGLAAVEKLIDSNFPGQPFCAGDRPGLADICLVPQLFNARINDCAIAGFKRLLAIEANCYALPAFALAHPERQPESGA